MILAFFNQRPQYKLRHVFTNCLINNELIKDYRCNTFVKESIRPQDEVILNHPLLISHFQNNYPYIPIIYSTTLNITDIDKINQITKNNIYVVNYNYNNDDNYLKQLVHKEHIELICAEPCKPGCPHRMEHYKEISEGYLRIIPGEKQVAPCPFRSEYSCFYQIQKLPTFISNERIKELKEQGFQYFKISGRTLTPPQWLETMLYYLAKPQYINEIRENLLNQWW